VNVLPKKKSHRLEEFLKLKEAVLGPRGRREGGGAPRKKKIRAERRSTGGGEGRNSQQPWLQKDLLSLEETGKGKKQEVFPVDLIKMVG